MDLFHRGETNVLVGVIEYTVSAVPIHQAIKHEKKFDGQTDV